VSQTISCQDCDATWELRTDLISEGIQAEQIRTTRGAYGSIKYFGVCEICQAKYRRVDAGREEDEFHRLFRFRDEVRTAHPDWTLQQAVTEAVRLVNDPWREPNVAFRHYLISVDLERAA
jgi:hypothetical protein